MSSKIDSRNFNLKELNENIQSLNYDNKNKNYALLCFAKDKLWRKAKKTKGIIARELDKDCIIYSIEGKLVAKKGQFLCRGIKTNDFWVQERSSLEKKYDYNGDFLEKVFYADEIYNDFKIYTPKEDSIVIAVQIDIFFEVEASWGKLKGKKFDYLVMSIEDALNPNPLDVWVVDKTLFESTYDFIY
ncbi:hypothetical protein EOM09_05810 [bacterium]|nr:hypothetical protein [bacterium]